MLAVQVFAEYLISVAPNTESQHRSKSTKNTNSFSNQHQKKKKKNTKPKIKERKTRKHVTKYSLILCVCVWFLWVGMNVVADEKGSKSAKESSQPLAPDA